MLILVWFLLLFCFLSTHLTVSVALARCHPNTHSPFHYGFQCSRPLHYFQGFVCVSLCVVIYVCTPNAASRPQCVYVYILPLMPLAGLSVCMFICLPLTTLPGIWDAAMSWPWYLFQGYPMFPTLTLPPGFCVCMFMCCVCLCAWCPFRVMFDVHALGPWPGLNECVLKGGVAHAIFSTTSFLQHGEQAY